jgi:hypothetical protein
MTLMVWPYNYKGKYPKRFRDNSKGKIRNAQNLQNPLLAPFVEGIFH